MIKAIQVFRGRNKGRTIMGSFLTLLTYEVHQISRVPILHFGGKKRPQETIICLKLVYQRCDR